MLNRNHFFNASTSRNMFFHKNGKSGLFWTFVKITFQYLQYKGIDYTVRIENRTKGIPTTANHAKTILTVGKNKIWWRKEEENSGSNSSNRYQSVHDIFSSSCTCVMCFCCLFYIVFKATYTKQCPCVRFVWFYLKVSAFMSVHPKIGSFLRSFLCIFVSNVNKTLTTIAINHLTCRPYMVSIVIEKWQWYKMSPKEKKPFELKKTLFRGMFPVCVSSPHSRCYQNVCLNCIH